MGGLIYLTNILGCQVITPGPGLMFAVSTLQNLHLPLKSNGFDQKLSEIVYDFVCQLQR